MNNYIPIRSLAALVASCFLPLCCLAQFAGAASDWVDVIDKVAVRIETVLYEKKDHPNFFIHVEVRNQGPYEIGIDLSDKWMVLYPNQWGGSDLDYRTVVNERAMPPKKLDIQLRARLIEAFKLKRLTDRKSTRLNSSHSQISYAVFCLKKKKKKTY